MTHAPLQSRAYRHDLPNAAIPHDDDQFNALAGVTQGDLDPLQLGPGQATALINALLHLRRLHLNVSHGVTTYIPGPAES